MPDGGAADFLLLESMKYSLFAEQGYCCGFQNENWINRVLRGIERFGMVGLLQLAEPH